MKWDVVAWLDKEIIPVARVSATLLLDKLIICLILELGQGLGRMVPKGTRGSWGTIARK